jgi:putative hydroxymethylpyrimidine transport system ATP-binding protein
MSKMALQFKDLSFHYLGDKRKDATAIFDRLSLEVNEGEFVSILGPSGSGKSTFFRLVTGLEQPVEGTIFLDGRKEAERLGKIGYMPQQDQLFPWRTVLQNAALPLELKGIERKEAYHQVSQLLQEFGLEGTEELLPQELSGGMRQRVSFLRTVLGGNSLLLLDEPFSSLDSFTRFTMQEWLLEQWTKRRKTVLFITHDVDEALFLSDRIFVFKDRPIRKIVEIQVPLSRPRGMKDLSNPAIIQIKQELLEQFRAKVKL